MRTVTDIRLRATLATVAMVALIGLLLTVVPGRGVEAPVIRPDAAPAQIASARQRLEHARNMRPAEIERRFRESVMMLHAKQYREAMVALHRVLKLAPRLPEAHVNMGFALMGLERHQAARDFFRSAIELDTRRVNAYYGLAMTFEQLCDRAGAVGAMRTYVHLTPPDDRFLRRARAALWEWGAEGSRAVTTTPDCARSAAAPR